MALASGVSLYLYREESASEKSRGFESHFDHHVLQFCCLVIMTKIIIYVFEQREAKPNNLEQL
jgi:hypothetical protein